MSDIARSYGLPGEIRDDIEYGITKDIKLRLNVDVLTTMGIPESDKSKKYRSINPFPIAVIVEPGNPRSGTICKMMGRGVNKNSFADTADRIGKLFVPDEH